MEEHVEERLPYEPPQVAEAGDFATETRGAGGLIPEYVTHIPH
ncbi:lasso RiPP family leader peptide-containing protein [Amycolatopsis rhizosphaerae]|nr:lasso RiPP family leader peptide-containing protein [Amycolatopsis rhizosphaerae]